MYWIKLIDSISDVEPLSSNYSKTCLKRNLKDQEHFSAEARFLFNTMIVMGPENISI
jgi:hypothetical protein